MSTEESLEDNSVESLAGFLIRDRQLDNMRRILSKQGITDDNIEELRRLATEVNPGLLPTQGREDRRDTFIHAVFSEINNSLIAR